jgi:hypothetical protein
MSRLLSVLLVFSAATAMADPDPMTREEIVDLARSGVDYSYWWGHDQWREDGAQHGSCSGSCPDCTHSGSYGADCSGYVGKVWQVPSPIALTTYSHPYSTREFRYSSTHWDQVSRGDSLKADAMVYRNSSNTGGHIVLYESGDPWGSSWVYEAKGCSYGIVHNLKSIGSSYVAIRRHRLESTPSVGTVQGVVYQDVGAGAADMSVRIPEARVSVSSGASATARENDAFWSFSLSPGDYTLTANAGGYRANSRNCQVSAGAETWCSIGLVEDCVPDCSGRQCGPDPLCGKSCGDCPADHACDPAGRCVCQPACGQRQCGPDPACGESCGSCPAGHACSDDGRCVCIPDCAGRQCGPDPVCGADCGACPPGVGCTPDGRCDGSICIPDCAGRQCGPDPLCGETCGMCSVETVCDLAGKCRPIEPAQGKLHGYVVKMEVTRTGASITGGKPLGGAQIQIGEEETEADEYGYYEMLVAPGEHVVEASHDQFGEGRATCLVAPGGHTECDVPIYAGEVVVQGGCATGGPAGGGIGLVLLFMLSALLRRVRPD